jgi:hypothetical protein
MSEQERDYQDKEVQDEILGKFHGEGYTSEQRANAIGNMGVMWHAMAEVESLDFGDTETLEVAEQVWESGLSDDFNEVYDAVVTACGLVIDNVNPAKVLGFVYGLHRASGAAIETYHFMDGLAEALGAMVLGLDEEE